MSNYVFQPRKNKSRNKYVGSWTETGWQEIPLTFSLENFASLLAQGAGLESTTYTHQDIAHWCDRFHTALMYGDLTIEDDSALKVFADVAEEVSAQWDLYLSNTYSLKQLQTLCFSKVELPNQWFQKWHDQVKQILP
ncbi:MAG: hypothetical protein KME12_18240 [Trichocoleus desertorum ATA4-8-CV12]|jgi:hypothetical protein|nr:hypothetical protein [Trichocoleus desertorum ATA4-8-CV12]